MLWDFCVVHSLPTGGDPHGIRDECGSDLLSENDGIELEIL